NFQRPGRQQRGGRHVLSDHAPFDGRGRRAWRWPDRIDSGTDGCRVHAPSLLDAAALPCVCRARPSVGSRRRDVARGHAPGCGHQAGGQTHRRRSSITSYNRGMASTHPAPTALSSREWPAFSATTPGWADTYATLHMWVQIAGKIRLKLAPNVNHWWGV